VHRAKLRLIADNAKRLGLSAVQPAALDATDAAAVRELTGPRDVDAALVDAPCSGLGTLRRNPELRDRAEADLGMLCTLQDRILDAVAPVVRPGGALVFSVCTITREESVERVAAFLERHADWSLEAPPPELAPFTESTPLGSVLRTWTHLHGCDGFFAARLVRKT
jgi:16S rRNA (cytosine967-C5)-methyltransferase